MKKILSFFLVFLILGSFIACSESSSPAETQKSTVNEKETKKENLSMWQMAGQGVGKILPEPELKYSLPVSSDFISAEIENATYEFFEGYVNQCISAGFNGSIGTAQTPDYYFNGETSNGETVQVMFYKAQQKVSISAFPAK